ncbi:PHP domain-containing protein [Alkanindiges sp. WGS2144]|uniref:PHP domain-containing protein n=1 Tax=Alkanindiges sp. WGS2144 TaxID=3366808 RepID=UPI003752A75E
MQRMDLHTHSHFSDGTLSPAELVEHAWCSKVDMLALTDHDTLDGLPQAGQAAQQYKLTLIDGVEISSQWTRPNKQAPVGMHIVALAPKNLVPLQELLQAQQQIRASRAEQICQRLEKIVKKDPWPEVLALAGGRAEGVTRSHIAAWLVQTGVVARQQQAFDRFLKEGKSAFVPLAWADLKQVLDHIKASGAQAVLAHPTRYNLSATHIRYMVGLFKSLGGHAVELPASNEPPATRAMIDHLIEQHDLAVSVSSDFHGSNMPWLKLGNVPSPKASQRGVWEQF